MKKLLLNGLCILCLMQTVFSQNNRLHLGVEAGIVRGFLKVPPTNLQSSFFGGIIRPNLGPRMGINIRYQIKPQFSFKVGTYFTQKGAASLMQPSPFGRRGVMLIPNETLPFNFGQLALMMRYHPQALRGFYLGMGYYGSLLISHPHKGFENRSSFTPRNTFDLGFSAALGQEFEVHKGNYMALEMSFELGTNDMSRFSDYRINEGSMLARAFNFGITYFFLPL